jgi:NAD(P)H-nitrite reductase large subunit
VVRGRQEGDHRLLGGRATFPGADLSTKLKLLGVDVASLSIDGAQVKLTYRNTTEVLQENMQRAGLQLVQMGAGWAIQRL